MAHFLVEKGAKLDEKGAKLHEKGAKLHEKDKDGDTVLIWAARNGHLDMVRCWVEKGAKLDEKSNTGETALMLAAGNGHLEVMRYLVDKGAALNEKDKDGCTTLMLATKKGDLEMVRYLVDKEAALNEKDKNNKTALILATETGHLEIVHYLADKGAALDETTEKGTALIVAADKGHFEIVRFLADKGAALNEKTKYVFTALILAIDEGNPDMVRFLADKGAGLDEGAGLDKQGNRVGITALMWAAATGQLELVRYLVDKGAALNERDGDGNTALMYAAFSAAFECVDTVRYLVRQGAQLDIKNHQGGDALSMVKKFKSEFNNKGNPGLGLEELLEKTEGMNRKRKDRRGAGGMGEAIMLSFQIMQNMSETINYLTNQAQQEWGMDTKVKHEQAAQSNSHTNNNNAIESHSTTIASPPLTFTLEVTKYSELKIEKELGEGSYGRVFKAKHGHEDVAVKQLNMSQLDEKGKDQFEQEATHMAKLHSRYTLRIVGICLEPYRCLVLEFMEGGSLHDYLEKNPSSTIQWLKRIELALDIGKGLAYIHARQVIHRDLKSLNVLLDKNQDAKIADFGLSTTKEHSQSGKTKSACGSAAWMAPELFDPDIDVYEYTVQTDMFAFAMVLSELANHQIPFQGQKDVQISGKIRNGNRPALPDNTPAVYTSLVTRCWAQESKQRPNADEAIGELNNLKQIESTKKQTPQHASLFSK